MGINGLIVNFYSPGIGTGLDDLETCLGEGLIVPSLPTVALGLDDLDKRLGVAGGVRGGVAPLPFARDSPIALTNSFTDTPWSSGGTSFEHLKKKIIIEVEKRN